MIKTRFQSLLSKLSLYRYHEALRSYIRDHHHHRRPPEEEEEEELGVHDANEPGVYAARELLAMFLCGRSGHPNIVGFLGWYLVNNDNNGRNDASSSSSSQHQRSVCVAMELVPHGGAVQVGEFS